MSRVARLPAITLSPTLPLIIIFSGGGGAIGGYTHGGGTNKMPNKLGDIIHVCGHDRVGFFYLIGVFLILVIFIALSKSKKSIGHFAFMRLTGLDQLY
jgi:hypothetical protein